MFWIVGWWICIGGHVEWPVAAELPVSGDDTARPAAAADVGDQSVSPVHQYVSYDERPLPAIRRSLFALRSTVFFLQLLFCTCFLFCA